MKATDLYQVLVGVIYLWITNHKRCVICTAVNRVVNRDLYIFMKCILKLQLKLFNLELLHGVTKIVCFKPYCLCHAIHALPGLWIGLWNYFSVSIRFIRHFFSYVNWKKQPKNCIPFSNPNILIKKNNVFKSKFLMYLDKNFNYQLTVINFGMYCVTARRHFINYSINFSDVYMKWINEGHKSNKCVSSQEKWIFLLSSRNVFYYMNTLIILFLKSAVAVARCSPTVRFVEC